MAQVCKFALECFMEQGPALGWYTKTTVTGHTLFAELEISQSWLQIQDMGFSLRQIERSGP